MQSRRRRRTASSGHRAARDDPLALDAFRIANRAMADGSPPAPRDASAGCRPTTVDPPQWRPFQLAFVLMNLRGIVDPAHADREIVDLLFFPTGGGKTEAYLGLAAFTLVLRRLRNPGLPRPASRVLMRYTLRLLTLDQLGRAAALICALELRAGARPGAARRVAVRDRALGRAGGDAEPDGAQGRRRPEHRRGAKTIAFQNDDSEAVADPARELPVVRRRSSAATRSSSGPNPDQPTGPARSAA